ncbi:MAG: hypothetical protein WCA19_06275 [Candidatus Acidiferrales bacterium]
MEREAKLVTQLVIFALLATAFAVRVKKRGWSLWGWLPAFIVAPPLALLVYWLSARRDDRKKAAAPVPPAPKREWVPTAVVTLGFIPAFLAMCFVVGAVEGALSLLFPALASAPYATPIALVGTVWLAWWSGKAIGNFS